MAEMSVPRTGFHLYLAHYRNASYALCTPVEREKISVKHRSGVCLWSRLGKTHGESRRVAITWV